MGAKKRLGQKTNNLCNLKNDENNKVATHATPILAKHKVGLPYVVGYGKKQQPPKLLPHVSLTNLLAVSSLSSASIEIALCKQAMTLTIFRLSPHILSHYLLKLITTFSHILFLTLTTLFLLYSCTKLCKRDKERGLLLGAGV